MYGCESFSLETKTTTPAENRVDVCSVAFLPKRSFLHSAPTELVLECLTQSQVHSVERGARLLTRLTLGKDLQTC